MKEYNGRIEVKKILVKGKTVKYAYVFSEKEAKWKDYFGLDKEMEISYSIDISKVPDSVLVVPFICNILPIAWLCNLEIYTESIDQDFFDNIEKIKEGYQDMYPMLSFSNKKNVTAHAVTNQLSVSERKSACFFSGGVDAYTTLFRHMDELPSLITIWGADVKLSDKMGWDKVRSHIKTVSQKFGVDVTFVKSNFRHIVNEGQLDKFVEDSGDGWWHGFQSGISIIGHAAPIAYCYGLKSVYIASSFPEAMKGKYTCASDPTIDNHVHYCGCNTVHDGYEMDRQEKVKYLVSKKEKYGWDLNLRVCWESSGGGNCCKCEKCYRTILEVVSEGGNPNECGFRWEDKDIRRCKNDMCNKIIQPQFNINQFYPPIQKAMKRNKDRIGNFDKYNWLLAMDFNRFNDMPMKKLRGSLFVRGLRRVYHLVMRKRK